MISNEWKKAFAKQSKSDLKVYELLCRNPDIDTCHRLHYLQMHLEKIAKSYLWMQSEERDDLPNFYTSHKVIAKVLPLLVKKYWRKAGYLKSPDKEKLKRIIDICTDLDYLAPSVDDDKRRPDNCEYPWPSFDDNKKVIKVPSEQRFPVERRIYSRDGIMLLKISSYLCGMLSKADE